MDRSRHDRHNRQGRLSCFDRVSVAAYIPLGISRDFSPKLVGEDCQVFAAGRVCARSIGEPNSHPVHAEGTGGCAIESSMDEHNSPLSPTENAAALSASALRILGDRAQAVLAARREQAARLEADLSSQLDAIAAALSEQLEAEDASVHESDSLRAEIARLTAEHEACRTAWMAERTQMEIEEEVLRQRLVKFETEDAAHGEEMAQLKEEFEKDRRAWRVERGELEQRRDELEQTVRKLEAAAASKGDELSAQLAQVAAFEAEREAWIAERKALTEKQSELAETISKLERSVAEDTQTKEAISARAAELEAAQAASNAQHAEFEREREELARTIARLEEAAAATHDDLSAKVVELEKYHAQLSSERRELELQREELAAKVAQLEQEAASHQKELAAKLTALEEAQAVSADERKKLLAERDELVQKSANLEQQLKGSQAEWRDQLFDFEERLRVQQASWTEQRTEWTEARTAVERERDELQQKFDLALEDVQRLRAHTADLEQELSRRPEAKEVASTELVALRAERDALAARVEQLERQTAAAIDPNVEQQLSDLTRRFELAVEDVRELKTKNARLEAQLAEAAKSKSKGSAPVDSGAMDWESQKRRLLAALEENCADDDPEQEKERVTIQATIEMTDAIVAEKDRQIAELQAQLSEGVEGSACQVERDPKVKELLDTDEIIAQHRKRVEELERELDQKLRTAELELSVERAKMARQKVELEELKSNLEAQRQALAATGGVPTQGQPKRRWLNKLGLGGEE